MTNLKRLIYAVFDKLDTLENDINQPRIQEIRGILYELLSELKNKV